MALTTEQLETIKTKIETDKIIPMKAIRALFPDENAQEVRKQLFGAYNLQELRAHSAPVYVAPTKEEKLADNAKKLARLEERKARLETEKTEIEAE